MPEIHEPGVHVQEVPSGARSIAGADTDTTAFVGRTRRGPVGEPVTVTSEAELHQHFGRRTRTWGMGTAITDFFGNGGRRAVVVRLPDQATISDHEDGLAALGRMTPPPSLLVLPPRKPQQQVPDSVWAVAAQWAVSARAFLLVDPPPGMQPDDVVSWADGLGLTDDARRNAALYYPRLRRPAPRAGRDDLEAAVACGAVAGVYARTDATSGVWKAPAGTAATLAGAISPEIALTDETNEPLNTAGINAIRQFPGRGTVVWGSRTLRGADVLGDDYKYVPVRRLALHLQRSIEAGIGWAAFEPDGEPLRAALRLHVGAFLHGLWRQGAFQGTKPDDAYFVRCDASTTTATDIAEGVVTVMVGFAPIKPAEFVIMRFRQRVGATS